MIKTKIAFISFISLALYVFPYSILLASFRSDFAALTVPGWKTTIYVGSILKFVILLVVLFFYWKLSKVVNEIRIKKFIIYFSLTIPGVLITKLDLYELFNFSYTTPESFIKQIQLIVFVKIFMNILFFTAQILFGVFYKKSTREINLNFLNSNKS